MAKTIFINLTRGTGINGITGIAPKNGNIIRPLLSFTRQQINMQDKQLNSYKKGAKGGGSGSDAKVRHLESRIEKLNELAEKNTESVSNARRDALQFKNEKTLLQNQINELKRKLTVAK